VGAKVGFCLERRFMTFSTRTLRIKLQESLYSNRSLYFVYRLTFLKFAPLQYLKLLLQVTFSRRSINKAIRINLLCNRDPEIVVFADKLRSKAIGIQYGLNVPITYKVWSNAEEIRELDLPRNCVVKPNHASRMSVVISENIARGAGLREIRHLSPFETQRVHPDDLKIQTLRQIVSTWMATSYFDHGGKTPEWAYKNIERRVFAEQLLGDGAHAPWDYRFFCVDGFLKFVNVNRNRESGFTESVLFSSANELIPGLYGAKVVTEGKMVPLENSIFEAMREFSESISSGQKFLRVDFYYVNGKIYLGELTNYPNAGLGRFRPRSLDRRLLKET
jgi:hypothetical protein